MKTFHTNNQTFLQVDENDNRLVPVLQQLFCVTDKDDVKIQEIQLLAEIGGEARQFLRVYDCNLHGYPLEMVIPAQVAGPLAAKMVDFLSTGGD